MTVTNVTDLSTLASSTLIEQVLREEKRQLEEKSTVAFFAKQVKNPEKPSNQKSNTPKLSKKGKTRPCCSNPKCRCIGHTIEKCWAVGGNIKGQCLTKSDNFQSNSSNNQPGNGSSKDSAKKDNDSALLLASEYLTTASLGKSSCAEWVIDSSASSHICINHNWFISYSTLHTPHPIILGDKRCRRENGPV